MYSTRKLGIDFGTTNSSASIVERNSDGTTYVKVLAVDRYDTPFETIRSVVGYKGDEIYVGNEGLEHLDGNEDNPILQVKMRLLDAEKDEAAYTIDEKVIRYSDVMSQILRRIRIRSEEALGYNAYDGVIMGVPVETVEAVKSIYLKALVKAGFFDDIDTAKEKTEFAEEPIAVSLHYGQSIAHQNKYALVFDYGGGTLDMAILKLGGENGEKHEVIAKGVYYGAGELFTKEFFLKGFCPQYRDQYCFGDPWKLAKMFKQMGFMANNLEGIWYQMEHSGLGWKFINKLDEAKAKLSSEESVYFSFDSGSSDNPVFFNSVLLTRDTFEKSIEEKLGEVRASIKRLLDDAKRNKDITKNDIDEVLMAGGSSMIPKVREILTDLFGENKVFCDVNPITTMTCISQGLAFAGYHDNNLNMVSDICSFSYGVMDTYINRLHTIIEKDTPFSEIDQYDFSKKMNPPDSPFKIEFEQVNMYSSFFELKIYEDNNEIMELKFDKEKHSGYYTLYFRIDAKRQILEVYVWDRGESKWVNDLPIGDRTFQLNSLY